MIQEQYVDLDTAKLLKEKGFDEPCMAYRNKYWDNYKSLRYWRKGGYRSVPNTDYLNVPTQQMAMRWLREEHNIDISIEPHSHSGIKTVEYEFTYWYEGYYHAPYQEKTPNYHPLFGKTYNTYEQACDAAIKYCLENLI